MSLFLEHLAGYAFLQLAVAGAFLASAACGIVGTYVTVRRISSMAGAIAHSVLAGLGLSVYLQSRWDILWLSPLGGAAAAAVAAALVVGAVSARGTERLDTVLSALWSIGMAVGLLFLFLTPGYSQDLMSYLFGNILMIQPRDLVYTALLDAALIGLTVLFYPQILAVSFDPEFARIQGVPAGLFFYLYLILTALTIVILVQMVGIVMVIALLTLPAAAAGRLTRRLWKTMALAVVFSLFSLLGGLIISYIAELPPGTVIILLSGAIYLLVLAAGSLRQH